MFLAEAVSPQLSISWELAAPSCAVLRLAGELEFCTARYLAQASDHLGALEATQIILDLSEVSFIDSAGLGALVRMYKRARGSKEFCMVLQPGDCRRLLDRIQLTRFVATYETLDDALAKTERRGLISNVA